MGRLGICSGLLVLFLIGVTVAACEGTGNIDRPIASPEPEIASIFEASAAFDRAIALTRDEAVRAFFLRRRGA